MDLSKYPRTKRFIEKNNVTLEEAYVLIEKQAKEEGLL